MPQPLIVTLLLFALVLPILGAIVLRVLTPRLTPLQLYGAAAALLGVVVISVLVLARGDIPSLQVGNLSILLPVTAPDDSILPLVPTPEVGQAPLDLATSAPITGTIVPSATAVPSLTPTLQATATQTATLEPTAAPTATPEPTTTPEPTPEPTAVPTAAPAPASQRTYTVQPGDTLLSIARDFNTTVTAIVEANNLTPQQADSLRVGQKLVIP
jgi:LysM repeat protein